MHWCSISPIGSKPGPMFVRGEIQSDKNELLLEIGNGCVADAETLALACLAPEIREYLELADTPVARMLLDQWGKLARDICRDQHQSDKPAAEPYKPAAEPCPVCGKIRAG